MCIDRVRRAYHGRPESEDMMAGSKHQARRAFLSQLGAAWSVRESAQALARALRTRKNSLREAARGSQHITRRMTGWIGYPASIGS